MCKVTSVNSNKILFLVVITLIACLGQVGSDIYSPSIPAIAEVFGVSINKIQFSMAVYMFGLAFSQLFYGPLSEGIGRKHSLIIGLTTMCIGSLLCFFAHNVTLLIFGRLIQGCGAGASSCLWRSIFRDSFTNTEMAKYGSYMSIVITFVIPATPTLGGYLQHYISWRASFAFLTLYAITALVTILFYFSETSQHHHIERLKPKVIFQSFWALFKNKKFIIYASCVFLSYGGFYSWYVAGPAILIDSLGISTVAFGWITFFAGGATIGLAGFINGRVVERFGTKNMLRVGWTLTLSAGLLLLLGYLVVGLNLYAVVLPVALFYFGIAFVFPNAFPGAFEDVGKIAGYAGALYGCFTIAGGSLMGAILAHLPHANQLPLAYMFVGCTAAAWILFEATLGINCLHQQSNHD